MDNTWWDYVSGPRKLIRELVSLSMNGKSVVLTVPQCFPWSVDFYESVRGKIQKNDPENSVVFIPNDIGLIEEYMFEQYCRKEIRAKYRPKPGFDKACFLAKEETIPLHGKHFIIEIHTKEKYGEWKAFVSHYLENVKNVDVEPASFIIVVDDAITDKAFYPLELKRYDDYVTDYDSYTYSALLVSEIKESESIKEYMTELLFSVCKDNIETEIEYLEDYKAFLNDPISVIEEKGVGSQEFSSMIWEAQIKNIFPYLEKYRSAFINKYKDRIQAYLPLHGSNNEIIYKEAEEVELGTLYYMSSNYFTIEREDIESLEQFKDARNSLAHLIPLDFNKIKQIFTQYHNWVVSGQIIEK